MILGYDVPAKVAKPGAGKDPGSVVREAVGMPNKASNGLVTPLVQTVHHQCEIIRCGAVVPKVGTMQCDARGFALVV